MKDNVSTMSEEAREAMRAYKREWNRANPEKRRAQQRRYWEKRAKAKQNSQDQTPDI